MELIIGLDLGTTNCKAVAMGPAGEVAASAARGYAMRSPRPGWAEQDVQEVWEGVVESLRSLASRAPVGEIAGLSLSGAMHSLLPVDKDGAPLGLAMTWADQRSAGKAEALRARTDAVALYQRTGCPLQALYYPAKLRWWVEEAESVAGRAAKFVAIKDWILFRLTGSWATDHSLASATGLQDISRLVWDEEALALAGVGAERLPALISPLEQVGKITPKAAQLSGLPAGLPVIAGASDGALANLGAGAALPGQTVITVGTSGAIRHLVDRPRLDPRQRTWCYILAEGRWFAGGAINNAGLAVQWVRDRFYPELPGEEGFLKLLADAAGIAPGAEGAILVPYFTGERNPHWDSSARAVLSGLALGHNRAHIARAVLEGVAFCLADVWEALNVAGDVHEPVRLTGGITQSHLWAQILADVLGVSLVAVEAADASAIGAAMLGFCALEGIALDKMASGVQKGTLYTPDPARSEAYRHIHQAFQDLYQSQVAMRKLPDRESRAPGEILAAR